MFPLMMCICSLEQCAFVDVHLYLRIVCFSCICMLLLIAYHAKEMPFFCYKASEVVEPMSFYVAVAFILARYLA